MDEPRKLSVVGVVTRQHGEAFADRWGEVSRRSGALREASAGAGIITWPDDPDEQERYHAMEHEIARRVFGDLRGSIVDTFVRIANEVLAKERRDHMTPPKKLNIVNLVTKEHGDSFADAWSQHSFDTGAITDAFGDTEVVEWPYDPHDGDVLYMEIENEIAQRVSDQLRSAASEAFVRIANEVLARAREQFKTP
jgi:hypothetical protein